ncbi:MAG: hypothetical protein AB1555_18600 [Nitrospirota bacterium]
MLERFQHLFDVRLQHVHQDRRRELDATIRNGSADARDCSAINTAKLRNVVIATGTPHELRFLSRISPAETEPAIPGPATDQHSTSARPHHLARMIPIGDRPQPHTPLKWQSQNSNLLLSFGPPSVIHPMAVKLPFVNT